jgi:predicted esterase
MRLPCERQEAPEALRFCDVAIGLRYALNGNVSVLRAAVTAAVILSLIGAASENLGSELRAAAARYYRNAPEIAAVAGRDTTMDYYDRLVADAQALSTPALPGYPPELWQRTLCAESQLDLSLATQLLDRSYQPMAAIRGLGETLVRSSTDQTLQPVAVYVPQRYVPGVPAPLVVFLHGHLQPESHLLAPAYVQDLAETTGTIVVAPYGRGEYDFRGAESDVYDAFEAANRSFTIDAHRRYLAGYSMGGFSVFRLAPLHPEDWSAVMSIAGSLLNSRASLLAVMPANVRYYVLTGALDDNVPTWWPTATAIFLRDTGRPVSFYSQSDGTHALYTLQPILERAWSEMEHGVVRSPLGLTGAPNLPDEKPR